MKPLLVVTLLLAFASPTLAADRNNRDVFQDVSAQVNRYAYFTIFDNVLVSVDDGFVALSGKVTMPFKASDLEKRVARIAGVKGVTNSIEVLPVSSFDDTLRLGIARAIYSNPALAIYGLGPNPSIHVIVDRGRVTLAGVVHNDMDRVIADHVARSSLAFEVRNELKTDDEVMTQMAKL